jgi:hypothetical protein
MKWRIVAAALIPALLIVSLSCGSESGNGLKILSQNMTVREFSGSSPQSMAVVHGRAQNVKNVIINSATISVNFYDKDKMIIATGSAVKQNLQPGEAWDFSIQTVGPDAWKIISYDIAASTE